MEYIDWSKSNQSGSLMRQLTFVSQGHVEWREAPEPKIQSALAATVRPLAIGRCDLDTGYVRGLAPIASGEPIGHEMIGEVVEVGDAVDRFRPGDRVIVSAQISCGHCRMCSRGFTGRCENVPFGASYGMGREGGFGSLACDLALVPFADAMLVSLPQGADPGAMIGVADMALDAWRAVGPQLTARPGARVLVMGGAAQVIGLYAAGIVVACGAGEAVYADDDPARRAQAARFGAKICRPEELSGAFEIIVEASGDAALMVKALDLAEPEALVTAVSIHFGAATPMPLQMMYWRGMQFATGRPNCRAQMEPLLARCSSAPGVADHFHPAVIEQTVYDFDDAPQAWMDPALRIVAARA